MESEFVVDRKESGTGVLDAFVVGRERDDDLAHEEAAQGGGGRGMGLAMGEGSGWGPT